MLPSIQLIFASWTHIDERTKLLSFSCVGYNVGATLAYPMTSLFCVSHPKWGWAFSYVFTGTLTTACAIAFYFFVFDSVHQHPRITANEKEYILSGISQKDEKVEIQFSFNKIACVTQTTVATKNSGGEYALCESGSA